MKELWNYLKTAEKPVFLYGMGNGADKILNEAERRGIKISGVFCSDGFVRDKTFRGFRLLSYSDVKRKYGNVIVLLCFGSSRPEVLQNIKKISLEQELLAPDVPVYGNAIFDVDYCRNNRGALEWVYSRLCDDVSRNTFECTVKYKITGDPEFLYRCEVSPNEPYESFLKPTGRESFLDLGAYNGDTVKDFAERFGDYKFITAVEPDPKNFRRLSVNTDGFKNIRLINACISDKCGNKEFSFKKGRGSSSGGTKTIPALTVDSIATETPVTFIKMDIEGEELNALKGAERTILSLRPKMLISCYHRSEDIITLPKAVLKLRDDYKLYMRHFPGLPAWDTAYYFI